ncbi:hypothetical protein [Bradyrhizobium barranii]|uniref:hypothetical protein n=1 Tax=Bradyrhizobium barranii TaxID=2992140 RepID=UPI0039C8ADC3
MAWLLLVATTGAINTLHGPVSTSVRTAMSDEIRRRVAMTRAGRRTRSIGLGQSKLRLLLPAARCQQRE